MLNSKTFILIAALALLALVGVGCKIVSGSFLVVETIEFTTVQGFYADTVDLTEDEDWEEHKDDIDRIEVVGFELWITNNEPSEWTYRAYVSEPQTPLYNEAQAEANATLVFGELTVPAATGGSGSTKYVSYAESFDLLSNIDELRALVKTGQFDVYGIAEGGGSGNGGQIDSLRIIVTVSATDS
ncbi:hypothetical protein GF420_12620 [candidate division GN15 bacterium]|nr:hypothetical protein [candidate division GN15 bacterium]